MSIVQAKVEKLKPAVSKRRRVTILGSTGSVGCQTIDLVVPRARTI